MFVAPAFLPSDFQCCIIASLTDANRSASGVPVKRWVLAIFLQAHRCADGNSCDTTPRF